MKKSLRAFMREMIDYAGLFPPAELSLDTSIHDYARYRKGINSWMLSRFIIPASRLAELKAYSEELLAEGDPYRFSVLGKTAETADGFIEEVEAVTGQCLQFHEHHGERITTDVVELKLPEEAVQANDIQMLESLLLNAARSFDGSARLPRYVFYEVLLNESWEKDLKTVLKAVSKHNKLIRGELNTYEYAGFKLRCGGTEASMFPSPELVAYALNTAREYDVAVKCTAGLHHPVRHFNETVQTKMHGFLNVFGAAMLAYAHDLTDEELVDVIREEDPEQFVFDDEAFSWRGLSVTTREIEELRETTLISYGSCSFEEPAADLKQLGLI